jgi:hypothetical protein
MIMRAVVDHESMYSGGGWVLGHTIDSTQASYVRVPFADTSTSFCLGRVTTSEIDARRFVTRQFGLDEFGQAYGVFARTADTGRSR